MELTLYSGVVAVHVMANLIAFGVWFAWPLLPGETSAAHRARANILRVVVTRAATVALVAGVYLASVAELFGEVWVLVPLVILVALLGVTGAFLVPGEQRLANPPTAARRANTPRSKPACVAPYWRAQPSCSSPPSS